MGKTGKWIRNFLTGKKYKEKDKNAGNDQSISHGTDQNPTTPISILPTTPKEKRRWSFRRSSAAPATCQKDFNGGVDGVAATPPPSHASVLESENEQKKHALAVAAATAAAADAAVAAAQAAAAVIRLTAAASSGRDSAIEEVAAVKIQSAFRGYLARKALSALKGLVKLQALVRGHLVRKQAAATLRCMQALVTVQARARAQRIRMNDDSKPSHQRQYSFNHRKPPQDTRLRHSNCHDMAMEENIKIVEMDLGGEFNIKGSTPTKTRNSYSSPNSQMEPRYSTQSAPQSRFFPKPDYREPSPAPSAATELSPRAYSGHFEDYHAFATAQSSPHYFSPAAKPPSTYCPKHDYVDSLSSYDYPLFPNYMANTESSRAKARSQSAPKSRPEIVMERQGSRRARPSVEGRGGVPPRAVRMQRSSSHVGSAAQNYQYPWSVMKLDRSTVSLKDSECGSTSTLLTNPHYCRSLVGFEISGNRY
ncbi:hypothetical protein NMG60_11032114 [Bertholletia excelsa]